MSTRKYTDVLFVGIGHIGGEILEQLARQPGVGKIVVGDITEEYAEKKINQIIASADQLGYPLDIEFRKIDLLEKTEKIAKILTEINPRVVMGAVTMMTPWVRTLLPDAVLEPIYKAGGLGSWVVFHLRLMYRLMQAIKLANLDCRVINASYADVVNPALGSVGLAPMGGGGNVGNLAAMARLMVAQDRKIKPGNVRIYLVTHYYNDRWFGGGLQGKPFADKPAPFFLKIMIDDRDVTSSYDQLKLLSKTGSGVKCLDGHPGDSFTASSFVKHILAVLHETQEFTHVPGPNGLPGGYPVHLGWEGAKLALPSGITQEEAIKINLEGQRRDGIEEIRADGTVVFTKPVCAALKQVFGIDCKSFNVREVDEVAEEQMKRFQETVAKFKKTG